MLRMSSNSCSRANQARLGSLPVPATNTSAADHSGQRLRHLSMKLSRAVGVVMGMLPVAG